MSWSIYFKGHVKAARHFIRTHKHGMTDVAEIAAYDQARGALLATLEPMRDQQFVNVEAAGHGFKMAGGQWSGSLNIKVEIIPIRTNEQVLGPGHEVTHPETPGTE